MGIVIFVFWVLCGVSAGTIYERKGRSAGIGFLGGLLLGPIGVLLALVASPDPAGLDRASTKDPSLRKCPHCAEFIKREANVCRYCHREPASRHPWIAGQDPGRAPST